MSYTIDADHSELMFLMETEVYYWNYPKIPPEVCNVNEEQMLGSYSSKKWAHPLITLCTKMVLLICENEFQHLGAIK